MRKIVRAAAIAAMLLFVPFSAHARYDTQVSLTPSATAFQNALGARDYPSARPGAAPEADAPALQETRGDMAPGQTRWLARSGISVSTVSCPSLSTIACLKFA